MITIGGNVTIGGQVIIGDISVTPIYFITEDDNFLISQTDNNFVAEQGPPYNV